MVFALDLERTLIADALTAEPRPGLLLFLTYCHQRFDRVVLYTTVEEAAAREVLHDLERSGHLPPGFLDRLEYVDWHGEYKDLAFIPGTGPDDVILVDDDPGWIRPDQRGQWVPVAAWDGGPDDELVRVRAELERRLGEPETDRRGRT